jgi:hypothetical protein
VAEQARVAAELAKKAEEAKVAEAERAKTAALAKEAERVKAAADRNEKDEKLAALAPIADQTPAIDLPRSLQSELRRVGCNTGPVDGNWNAAAQKALDLFNRHAGIKLDVKVANTDALDAVKSKSSRVCPLICDHGFKADGDRCTKITCRAGYEVGDDNNCEKIEVKRPTAKRDGPKRERQERAKTEVTPSNSQASSGQVICGQGGCRPVQKGCRLVYGAPSRTSGSAATNVEVCN